MLQSKTVLKKLLIRKFRALTDVEVDFGSHITVICGKNGTSKSSILGIVAQFFSFDKDYVSGTTIDFQTITGSAFKSLPSEHFRFSDKFDTPGSLHVAVELIDGYTGSDATGELELSKRSTEKGVIVARPVVRKNSTVKSGNKSRNFTHPVIYLSLSRLQPIAARNYTVQAFHYLNSHKPEFINLNNELLNKTASVATGTSGTINSAVAHATNYDQDSVSAGEDNAGQIILALMSFKKLKEEYSDYKGGLLLIDEADAGLFPAAQIKLLKILDRECSELNLQVIVTTHSPTMVEHTHQLSTKFRRKFKTIYLSDTYGPVRSMHDMSWPDIYADLATTVVHTNNASTLPRINVYAEDGEGFDFLNALLIRHKGKKFIKEMRQITLGCTNYMQLIKKGIPEFSEKSLIALDGDAQEAKKLNSVILLPGTLPPEQLIFEFLYNLKPDDEIWQNGIRFNRPALTNISREISRTLSITQDPINLTDLISAFRTNHSVSNPKAKHSLREIFKDFYQSPEFQAFLSLKGPKNPWNRWISEHQAATKNFRNSFSQKLVATMIKGYGIEASNIPDITER